MCLGQLSLHVLTWSGKPRVPFYSSPTSVPAWLCYCLYFFPQNNQINFEGVPSLGPHECSISKSHPSDGEGVSSGQVGQQSPGWTKATPGGSNLFLLLCSVIVRGQFLSLNPHASAPVQPAFGEWWGLPYGHLLKKHLSCIIKELIFQQAVVLVCNSSLPLSGWMGYSSQFQIILYGQRVDLPECWLSSRREGMCISRREGLGVIFNRFC